jgi:hypothetical protein
MTTYGSILSTANTTGATNTDLDDLVDITAGQLLLMKVTLSGNKTCTISDDSGGGAGLTWTQRARFAQIFNTTEGVTSLIFTAPVGSSDTGVTVNINVGTATAINAELVTITDADNSDPVDVIDEVGGTDNAPTGDVTTTVDGCFVFACVAHETQDFSSSGLNVETTNLQSGGGAFVTRLSTRWIEKATAGLQTMAGSLTGAENWAVTIVAIKPAPAAGGATPHYYQQLIGQV